MGMVQLESWLAGISWHCPQIDKIALRWKCLPYPLPLLCLSQCHSTPPTFSPNSWIRLSKVDFSAQSTIYLLKV